MNLIPDFTRFKMMNLENDSKNWLNKAQYGYLFSSNISKIEGFYYPFFIVFLIMIDRRLKRHTHVNTGQNMARHFSRSQKPFLLH